MQDETRSKEGKQELGQSCLAERGLGKDTAIDLRGKPVLEHQVGEGE